MRFVHELELDLLYILCFHRPSKFLVFTKRPCNLNYTLSQQFWKAPKMNLRPSRADTKSMPTAELPSASIASRWVWRIIKWFSLSCVIVEHRYVLTRRTAKNASHLWLASLEKVMRVTISENMHVDQGTSRKLSGPMMRLTWLNHSSCFLLAVGMFPAA